MDLDRVGIKGFVITFSAVAFTATAAGQRASGESQTVAQANRLSEQRSLIGACRVSAQNLDVYADSSRTVRLATIAPNVQVTLTGVTGTGVAEIRYPSEGWVDTSTMVACPSGSPSVTPTPSPTPTPTPTPSPTPSPTPTPGARACYRVDVSALSVRSAPTSNANLLGFVDFGQVVYATTNPPNERLSETRVWVAINYQNREGWIARTGANQIGNNIVRLPDAQCNASGRVESDRTVAQVE